MSRGGLAWLTAALLAIVAIAWMAARTLASRDLESRRQQAAAQRSDLERAQRECAARLTAAVHARVELQATLEELRRPVQPRRPSGSEVKRAGDEFPFSVKALLEEDPKLQVQHLKAQKLVAWRQYGALCRMLALNPEQTEKFLSAISAHRERLFDIEGIALAKKLAVDDSTIATARRAADEALSQAQRAVLGDAGFRQLEDYERTVYARMQADGLARRLALTDEQLRVSQTERLAQAIANASNGYRRGGKVDDMGEYQQALASLVWRDPLPDNIDWDAVRADGRKILSPAQQAHFENSIAQYHVIRIFNLAQAYTRRGR